VINCYTSINQAGKKTAATIGRNDKQKNYSVRNWGKRHGCGILVGTQKKGRKAGGKNIYDKEM